MSALIASKSSTSKGAKEWRTISASPTPPGAAASRFSEQFVAKRSVLNLALHGVPRHPTSGKYTKVSSDEHAELFKPVEARLWVTGSGVLVGDGAFMYLLYSIGYAASPRDY
jgi:hypothetical protein